MSRQQLFPVQIPEENKTGQDLEHRRHRDTQADAEERTENAAHEDRHGDAHQKGRRHALYRNEAGVAQTVIKADEAEQETGEQTVDSVGFEIIPQSRSPWKKAR